MARREGSPEREDRPLAGRRVLIARGAGRSNELTEVLEVLGARSTLVPVIRHEPLPCREELRTAWERREAYAYIVFTSQTAVPYFERAMAALDAPPSSWRRIPVAAVGNKTATALENIGVEPAVVTGGGAASLARNLLEEQGLGPGARVLFPRSALGRPELPDILQAAGVTVDTVSVYDTKPQTPSSAGPLLKEAFAAGPPDAAVFSSPSAFLAFLELAGAARREAMRRGHPRIVSIGPTTSEAIRAEGFVVAAEAQRPTVEEMARAIVRAIG